MRVPSVSLSMNTSLFHFPTPGVISLPRAGAVQGAVVLSPPPVTPGCCLHLLLESKKSGSLTICSWRGDSGCGLCCFSPRQRLARPFHSAGEAACAWSSSPSILVAAVPPSRLLGRFPRYALLLPLPGPFSISQASRGARPDGLSLGERSAARRPAGHGRGQP